MKKTFILEELDCAHCGAKIESAISKLEGVNKASVTFMNKKLVMDIEEDQMDKVISQAKKVIKKIEPDVEMVQR